ncbi:MAG TPA: hypothetical protein VFI39_08980 [Gemmatimonadales bacterium]|nr:hypothetical protein [Gemmatimonadales bacterium]
MAAVACSDTLTSPPGPEASKVIPFCQLGCLDQDPHPDSAGVFLGSGITPDMCTDGTDSDQDGLEDFCETNLALAFAPELRYSDADEVGREPYWAARPISRYIADTVVIAYLISYYRDAGSNTWGCSIPSIPFIWDKPVECNGHNGDSEAIVLDVYYSYSTKHWILGAAIYSQHDSPATYSRYLPLGFPARPYPMQLEYPSHPGAYPRAYVAEGKHANYNTQSECNSGGTLGSDTCENVNTSARLPAGYLYNLGSRAHPAIDCVTSRDPSYLYYGSGKTECYWTGGRFRGWIPYTIGGVDTDPYSPKLSDWGF